MTDTNPVSLTRSLLAFDTINPPGDERTCAHYVGGFLEESGFHVDYHEFGTQRTSLVARLVGSGAKSPICFTGHLDTVPLGKMNWSMDPFAGEMDGNRFYGRGTSDMKAAIAGILLMGRRLSELKRRVADIVLVLTAGEETGCQGSRYLAGLGGEVLGEAGAIVVGEPTANQPLIGHKGVARYEIMTAGITAHASMPEQGDNAIHKVAEVVQRLQSFNFGVDPHDILGAPTLNIGTITGGININSVPDQARLGIDIRTIPGQDAHDIKNRLQKAAGAEATVTLLQSEASLITDVGDEWVQEVYEIMTERLGRRPSPGGVTYFTDGSNLKAAYGDPPTIILGPGETTQAHKTDEYCLVSNLEMSLEAYIEIARRWCCA